MDWTHAHLALNHIPVLGPPFLLLMLVWSWARREQRTLRFCLKLFVALAVAAIAIKFTGDFAAERPVAGLEPGRVQHHEQTADQASTAVFVLGLAAVFALWRSRSNRPTPHRALAVLAILTLVTFAFMARTANSGGQLRHPELRSTPAQTQLPTPNGPR